MKKITLATLLLMTLVGCKKQQTTVSPTPTTSTYSNSIDSSKVGRYDMVYCSIPDEFAPLVSLTLSYRKFRYNGQDTTSKIILYNVEDNMGNQAPKRIRVSSTVTTHNENTQPYIELYKDKIYGFTGGTNILEAKGYFDSDTLILEYAVQYKGQQLFLMKCKYLK